MMRVLVTVATKYGATGEIARVIGEVLGEQGLETTILPPEQVEGSTAMTRWCWAVRWMPGTG